MAYPTKDSGWMQEDKDSESKSGPMDPSIMDSGKITKLMDKVRYTMLMVMFIKENGLMTKPVVKELTPMKMERSILVNGRMISKMDTVLNSGWMVKSIKDSIKTVQIQERVSSNL